MRVFILRAVLALSVFGFSFVIGQEGISTAGKTAEDTAVAGAESWLKLVDSGRYGEAWNTASGYLKDAVKKQDFEKSLSSVRKPLGKVISRSVSSREFMTSLPGAPDGEYVVIQFKTSFENKKEAVETITPRKDKDGRWRVSGYYIR